MLSRRGLFIGGASLLAAPALVRASSLMPVAPVPPVYTLLRRHVNGAEYGMWEAVAKVYTPAPLVYKVTAPERAEFDVVTERGERFPVLGNSWNPCLAFDLATSDTVHVDVRL